MDKLCIEIQPSCVMCGELSGVLPYTFDLGLTPLTSFYFFVRDKFNQIYRKEITTDADGKFVITDADFPGLFNKNGGDVAVWLSNDLDGEPRFTSDLSSDAYECIIFTTLCT